jgi:biopolymer transport protein ExbB
MPRLSADILVQTVMIGLAFASLVTWTVWLAKNLELWAAMRRLRRALAAISGERSLGGRGRVRAGGARRLHRPGAHALAGGRFG